jgi:hypothetical protein
MPSTPTTAQLVAGLHGSDLARSIRAPRRADLRSALAEAASIFQDHLDHPGQYPLLHASTRVAAGCFGPAFGGAR